MGLMGGLAGMGAAIESSAGYALRSAMDELKALRIAENSSRLRVSEEVAKEGRMKASAAEERERVSAYMKPGLIQSNAATAAGSGANDILPGADENVGVDVQNRVRTPTMREAQQRAAAAGDLQAMNTLGVEANRVEGNAREDKRQAAQENRWKAEDEKWQRQYSETVRHNKAVEANAAEKLSPAAKAQLESVTARVSSAQKAELEAAKALETARKSMADPAAIAQLEGEYRASKAIVQTALMQYDAVGEAHFGDKWKKIETPAAKPQDVRVDGKVIGQAVTQEEAAKLVAAHKAGGGKPSAPASTAKAQAQLPAAEDKPVQLERAGSGILGSKQFVATYADGRKEVVSGPDAERQFILQQ